MKFVFLTFVGLLSSIHLLALGANQMTPAKAQALVLSSLQDELSPAWSLSSSQVSQVDADTQAVYTVTLSFVSSDVKATQGLSCMKAQATVQRVLVRGRKVSPPKNSRPPVYHPRWRASQPVFSQCN
jgi:hypothetical protein